MKSPSGVVKALSSIVAAAAFASTANAAVYNMTTTSGTYKVDDGIVGQFSIDLTGAT